MNHPVVEQIERFGYPLKIKRPSSRKLGMCPCGCGQTICADEAYIRWDDRYFTDRNCVMKYLAKTEDFEEVG